MTRRPFKMMAGPGNMANVLHAMQSGILSSLLVKKIGLVCQLGSVEQQSPGAANTGQFVI